MGKGESELNGGLMVLSSERDDSVGPSEASHTSSTRWSGLEWIGVKRKCLGINSQG